MPEIVVAAQSRTETGKNVNRRLRTQGLIPGVLYGRPRRSHRRGRVSRRRSPRSCGAPRGRTRCSTSTWTGKRRKVILKEFQLEPIKGQLLHADFYEVALDKILEVKVHVELHGTPVGVKIQGGILDFVTRELEVECLPDRHPREDRRRRLGARARQAPARLRPRRAPRRSRS